MLISQSSFERLDKFTEWSDCPGNDVDDECCHRKHSHVYDSSRRILSGRYYVHGIIMSRLSGWYVFRNGWENRDDSNAMFNVLWWNVLGCRCILVFSVYRGVYGEYVRIDGVYSKLKSGVFSVYRGVRSREIHILSVYGEGGHRV